MADTNEKTYCGIERTLIVFKPDAVQRGIVEFQPTRSRTQAQHPHASAIIQRRQRPARALGQP